jgi:hypothetical protein
MMQVEDACEVVLLSDCLLETLSIIYQEYEQQLTLPQPLASTRGNFLHALMMQVEDVCEIV